MAEKIRRVVTGHNEDGKSVFIMDGIAPAVMEMLSMPGLALTDLWQTGGAPADNSGQADAADRPIVLEPPANGSILRIVEFPPDSAWRDGADAKAAVGSIGAGTGSEFALLPAQNATGNWVKVTIVKPNEERLVAVIEDYEYFENPASLGDSVHAIWSVEDGRVLEKALGSQNLIGETFD